MRNVSYIDKHEEQCKEVIQYIIEYLIYGDKSDSTIFDLFCEYNFMNEFIFLANLNHRSMNLQIVKSFSVLILNLTNTTTMYYIFSNNFINQIITNDYEKYDDDFLSYYVNFIKSLSLKIDQTTIQFFFHRQLNSFPLLQSAMKLYNHTDPMIKNVVRNIILTVMKIRHEPITQYFSTLPSITYFPFLACRLRDLVLKLNEEIMNDDQAALKSIHDDIIDDILYLQDIFSLKLEKINYILTNSLFYYLILPLLCGCLISMTKPKIAISMSIYILLTLFHYIKDESFLNATFSVLFSDNLSPNIMKLIEEYPKNAKNYFFDWNAQKKSNYSSFTSYISSNFSEPFIKSLIYQNSSPYQEITAIAKKFDRLAEELNPQTTSIMKMVLEDFLAKFSNSEFDIMTTYHKHLSIATGVNVGLSVNDNTKECFLISLEEYHKKKKSTESVGVNNLIRNECRENLYSYLKSKDDTLILLVSLLIFTIHKKGISKELLAKAKILKASEFSKSEYDTNRILNEIFSINENTQRVSKSEKGMENNQNGENSKDEFNLLSSSPFDASDSLEKNESSNINLDSIKVMIDSENNPQEQQKIVSFDNSFFSDLFSFDSDVGQKIYDCELVDSLLNLLMVEPPFRTITNRIILENITSLLIKEEGFSFVERSQLDIINKIYYTYLSNIKLIILNNKYIRETGFELFEMEWKNYKVDISHTAEELVSRPFLLIPFNLEDIIEDYPKILRIQKTEVDSFKSNLIIFMHLYDLRNRIYKEGEFIKNSFPLRLGGFELEIDQSYNLTSKNKYLNNFLDIGLEIYPCKLKFSHSKNFLNYILIIYQNYLYFALPDIKDSTCALIKYKYALRHLEAQIDRSDPRILNIIVKDKNNYLDIAMDFNDVNKTSGVKKSLEEQRKSSRNTEYLLLDSYFDDLITNWKF